MSLLTLCSNVAKQIGVGVPTIIIGNTDETAVRLLALANRSGKSLMRKHNWAVLIKEATVTTVASTANYSLESDYDRSISDTAWDRTNYDKMRRQTTAQWQFRKSAIVSDVTRKNWRIKPNANTKTLYIDPTPTAVETLVYEYVSNQWCQSSGGTGQTAWAVDTDIGVLDEDLLELDLHWRMLKAEGFEYAEERDEFDKQLELAIGNDGGAQTLNMQGQSSGLFTNVPETGFG